MRKAVIDESGTLHALMEMGEGDSWSGPEGMSLVDAEGFEPDPSHDEADYRWDGGGFALKDLPEPPVDAGGAAAALLSAVPALSAALTDAQAVRMKPYLPTWDARADYPEGSVCLRSGKACRRTSSGWREIG